MNAKSFMGIYRMALSLLSVEFFTAYIRFQGISKYLSRKVKVRCGPMVQAPALWSFRTGL